MEQTIDNAATGKNADKSNASVKPDYGNWVSTKFIYGPGLIGVVCLAASILFWPLIVIAAVFFLIALYFIYARHLFFGGVQNRIWDLVVDNLEWNGDGMLLDIGCGNAAIDVKLAKKYPNARITGVDYWGKNWEYSKGVCEKNAAFEGVGGHMTFRQASAAKLPFGDETFDAVVSNLTFHEVRDAKDKREVVREALRVLKKGGKFTLQDLFLIKNYYGTPEALVNTIKSWGVSEVEFIDTHNEPFIPRALKLPFMVGTISIIKGKK